MSFWVDSADRSEKRISASAVAEPSAPIDSARSHSPRRTASTPSWMAVAPGCAGGRQRDRQAARAEPVGEPVGDGAEHDGIEDLGAVLPVGDGQQPFIA